jgi:hypothetical protein
MELATGPTLLVLALILVAGLGVMWILAATRSSQR